MKRFLIKMYVIIFIMVAISYFLGGVCFADTYSDKERFEQCVANDPENITYYQQLADIYKQLGYHGVTVFLDGRKIDTAIYNVEPIIKPNQPYIPIRALAEYLGASRIDYELNGDTATIIVNGNTILIKDCGKIVYINGTRIYPAYPPVEINWRYLVNIDFINSYMARSANWVGNDSVAVVQILKNPVKVVTSVNTPTISPSGGTYTESKYVAMYSDYGSTIYYTLNGDTPTIYSNTYTSPILISSNTTLKARAYKNGIYSDTRIEYYYIQNNCNLDVWFNLSGGTYSAPQYLTMSSDYGNTIYYTLDGSTPSSSSNQYYGQITINNTTTVKARVYKNGVWGSTKQITISISCPQVQQPTISPSAGTYSSPQYVTLSSSDGAVIRYTTDGSEPNEWSTVYYSSIYVNNTTIIKAKAYKNGTASTTVTASYTINQNIQTPTASPSGGTYSGPQYVTIYSIYGCVARYTTDGSEPTYGSLIYSSPIYVDRTMVLKVKAYKDGIWSNTLVLNFTINETVQQPVISPNGGTYSGPQYVSIYTTDGSTIRYTTNGNEPTTSSCTYTSSIFVDRSMTIKAKAFKNSNCSTIATAAFYINQNIQQPTISPSGGTYNSPQYVTLYSADGGIIRYTTDGNEPYDNSMTYSNPIYVDRSMTIKARVYKDGVYSSTLVASYNIYQNTQGPSISPSGGTYYQAQYVTIYSNDGGTIRYTTDGNEPNDYSLVYSGSIYVDRSMTIKARSYRNGTWSQTAYAVFTILNNVGEITASPQAGVFYQPVNIYLYCSDNSLIRYTTDGSEPNEWSSVYYSPIYVDRTTKIRAKVFRNGNSISNFKGTYVIVDNYYDNNYDESSLTNARSLYNSGRYDEAITALLKFLDRYKDNEEAMLLLIDCYIKKGDAYQAKEKLKQFVYVYEYPRVVNRYAELCNQRYEYEEARQKILAILPRYQGEVYLYKTLADSYKGLRMTGIKVFVYGNEVDFSEYDNVKPQIHEGRTLIPIRALSEALGARVDWDYGIRKATIYLDDDAIEIWDRQNIAKVNGVSTKLDVPAFIYRERLLVPIRFVSEKFGREVDWFSLENTVNIISVYNK